MATTNLGRVAIVPQGIYSAAVEYKKLDLVNGLGGSYMYINSTPAAGVSLTDTSHWQQIASMGGQDLVDAAVAARDAAQGYKDAAAASAAQLAAGTASPAGTYADLDALIADNPDNSKIYITLDDGNWCYHNGATWVAGGVYQAASVVEEYNLLKGDLVNLTESKRIEFVDSCNITLSIYSIGDVVNLTPTMDGGWRYSITSCKENDVILLNCHGGWTPRAYAFLDTDNKMLSVSDIDFTATDLILIAPENSSKIVINDSKTNGVCYFGYLPNRLEKIENNITVLDDDVDEIKTSVNGKEILPLHQKTFTDAIGGYLGEVIVGHEYVVILPTEPRGGVYLRYYDGITEVSRYTIEGRWFNEVADSTGLWIGRYNDYLINGTVKVYDVTDNPQLREMLYAYFDEKDRYGTFQSDKPYSIGIRQINTEYTNKHIATLGDSITEQATWQLYLQQLIGANAIDNNGIGGTRISGTSSYAMWQDGRINDISNDTDTVIVMGGTNDGIALATIGNITIDNRDTDTFVGAYNVLISKLYYKFNMSNGFYNDVEYSGLYKSEKTNVNIVIMTMPHSKDETRDTNFIDYAEAIRKVGNLWGIKVIDLFANCGINRITANTYLKDTVHPNYEGGKLIAKTIANYLCSIYR